jgi:hypothetical protein
MKHRVSITINEDTLLKVLDSMRDRSFRKKFRNKSHLFECAIEEFLGVRE